MNTEEQIERELSKIESEISKKTISSEFHELLSLFSIRTSLIRKLKNAQWNKLSIEQKTLNREKDLDVTYKYYEKFPNEIGNKYLYKKKYIDLLRKLNNSIDIHDSDSFIFSILYHVLNSEEYINIQDSSCITSIISHTLTAKKESSSYHSIIMAFEEIKSIPYELK